MSSSSINDSPEVEIVDRLVSIFSAEGSMEYLGEIVTMSEHMIQTAMQAEDMGAPESMVAAALLHDIGYFSHVNMSVDQRHKKHDEVGALFLSHDFGTNVTEPIRLHVQAKRYLSAVVPNYQKQLSDASIHTLELQGSLMSAEECRAFETTPYHKDAIKLRLYDNNGKVRGRAIKDFNDFLPLLHRLKRGR